MQLTMIMNTTGHHPHLIAEAIGSALAQTNQNFKLMINCIHPDGLYLDKHYPNITINNIPPFEFYAYQVEWAIKQLDTPYWCILDSDDYILPNHTENLLQGIEDCKQIKSLIGYHSVGNDQYWYLKDGDLSKETSGGWWRYAITRPNMAWLKTAAENFNKLAGFDSLILSRIRTQIRTTQKPTYVYKYGESWHLSKRKKMPAFETLPIVTPRINNDILLLCN